MADLGILKLQDKRKAVKASEMLVDRLVKRLLSVADALGGQDERGHTKWKSVEIEGMGFPTSIVGSGRPPIPADALPSVQELGEALVRWHQAKDQEWEAWNALTDDERARLADLAPVPDR